MVMGQVALGFRSLLTKAAIFFVMAALLAWALGGTLWPRAHVVDGEVAEVNGTQWWWQMRVGGGLDEPRWTMMMREGKGAATEFGRYVFSEVAGPVVVGDRIAFAGRVADRQINRDWFLYLIESAGAEPLLWGMPDRLAVEQQLARFAAGLPVQDERIVIRQRSAVLDPADDADTEWRQ